MNCSNCSALIIKSAVAAGGFYFCSRDCRDRFTTRAGRGIETPASIRKRSSAVVRRKLTTPSEGSISANAAGVLDRRGGYHTRLQSGARPVINSAGQRHYMKLCAPGTPDRMFADGLVVFLEVKRPGKDRTPDQERVADQLKASGSLVFKIDGFGQIEFLLAELDKRRERIDAIRAAIAGIQNEIDSAFTLLYGE